MSKGGESGNLRIYCRFQRFAFDLISTGIDIDWREATDKARCVVAVGISWAYALLIRKFQLSSISNHEDSRLDVD
jgi:hypothetical protein